MSHLHRCPVRSKVVVDPARKHGRFHRHRPGLRQRPNPLPQALPRRRNRALRQHLATEVLHAITDRLLVDVQPDEVHTGHEEPPWMSLNQPLLLSSALVHQVLLSPTTYPYKQVTYGRAAGSPHFDLCTRPTGPHRNQTSTRGPQRRERGCKESQTKICKQIESTIGNSGQLRLADKPLAIERTRLWAGSNGDSACHESTIARDADKWGPPQVRFAAGATALDRLEG